nr:RNA-directed DNA polymerase, eukaryota, reverse transcriptase zinc-binding domain protein [Tanacetum cinerariifolium]
MLDYGPTPFRFFHYWIEVDGFVKMVEDTWNVALGDSSNAIFNLINKLMFLKEKIRAWKFEWKNSSKSHLISSKLELAHLDALIDNGEDLEIDVSNEEIKKAVWDCGLDKSPGPDGFTFGFYRHFWKLIEKDMVDAVKYFFKHGALPNGSNSSFIALIPKNPGANMVKDFRPISLIGSFYKIIAKILANRLIFILGDIVNEVQLAFVADRQILDCPFILNELFQWSKSKKKQTMIFKVDFEKAFDSIRCLRSSWGSIIVNGSPTDEFKFFKGLKQGDPFSPFLFIIIMESLHISFQRVVDAVHVLDCFYRASGLRINMCKSKLIGISVGEERVNQDASKIGCLALKAPFSYLGTKVRGIMSRIHSWKEIIDSMVLHLSKWKMKTLFIGGGLGVSSLYALNRALVFKWVWRFTTQRSSLWATVIKVIHEDDGKMGKYHKSAISSPWLDIVHELELFKQQAKFAHTSFDHSFRHCPRSGVEQTQLSDLQSKLAAVSLVDARDKWKWSLEGSGDFSISSIRKWIDDKRLLDVSFKTRWIKVVPIKINIHAWKVRLDYLPIRLNISCRVVRTEKLQDVFETALPPAPPAEADAQDLVDWGVLLYRYNEVACLMLGLCGRVQKYKPQGKAKGKGKGKGKGKVKHKHEVFETFKVFKGEVENQLRKTIKAIQSDRGGEYTSQEFKDYLKACGIVQQLTPPYTSQHNGVSERRNRTLLNMVLSMMSLATFLLSFWDYALECAARILNMVPTKKVDKTPYELWNGKVPNLSYLKESRRIVELEDEDILPFENTSEHPIEEESLASIVSQEEDVILICRFVRTHKAPDRLCLNVEIDPNRLCFNVEVKEHSLEDFNEPANYKAALSDPKFKKWLVAINTEMQSVYDNKNNMPPKRTSAAARAAVVAAVPMTAAAVEQLIEARVSAALANHEALRNSTNGQGDGSHNYDTGTRGTVHTPRECTYKDFLNYKPLTFKGTEGVVVLTQWFEKMESVFHISNCAMENQVKFATCTFLGNALTWWNSHMKDVTQDVAYAMDWKTLRKMMTDKYCSRGEIEKLEIKLWNLKVKGTNAASYTLHFQELALMCGRMFHEESEEVEKYLMDQKVLTIFERQAEQKRKMELNAGNNQGHQQQNKRQNTRRAYTIGPGEKREYTGSLPLCTKFNFHHKGPCAPRCNKCKKIDHLARDCRSSGPNNNNNNRGNLGTTQNAVTCYECGVQED